MKKVKLTKKLFHGCASLEEKRGIIYPHRLPHELKKLFPSPGDGLMRCASFTSGVRLRFKTNTQNIAVVIKPWTESEGVITEYKTFDLVIKNKIIESLGYEAGKKVYSFAKLPAGQKTIEIWLPPHCPVGLKHLEIDDKAKLSPAEDKRFKWITYGSSITHDRRCISPARIWPAIVAREKDLNLTTLGFGGNCHLEPMVARYIRDLPADFISLKLGINIQGAGSLSPRTFQSSAIGFIQTIREKHKTTPIAVISPIICPPRETVQNHVGLSLTDMRKELQTAVKSIKEVCGDKNIYYFSGLKMFNEKYISNLPDELHPDAEGSFIMAENFIKHIYNKIKFKGKVAKCKK